MSQRCARVGYLEAEKKCDVVMAGGITSGIVYPGAVCKLAEVYRFQNIGGTSAGAIAAAATAAAEYARRNGSGAGFEKFCRLPAFLSAKVPERKETNLFWLFQPDESSEPLFDLAMAFAGKKGSEFPGAAFGALVRFSPLSWMLAIGIALALAIPAIRGASTGLAILDGVLALVVFAAVLAILLGAHIVMHLARIPGNAFGLCPGRSMHPKGEPPGLTDWLSGYLNDIAGKPPDKPLTFGDLRSKGIKLRMITTCLTHRRPYGLPLDSNQFYYRKEEFLKYFPEEVVAWMEAHPGPAVASHQRDPIDTAGFLRLPEAGDLPVVVAARMSLSFPVLFKAVPLYAIDFSLRRARENETANGKPGGAVPFGKPRVPERCWFMDGGICSNFPLHLFDSPIPRWPTFGINLQPLRADRPQSFVWMPDRNEEGFGELWSRMEARQGLGPLLTYAAGIVDAARNWMDNRQVTVPGYRDRVVQVRLDDANEGGLNLNMPEDLVKVVSRRGNDAAALLLEHFVDPPQGMTLTWDNHRWVRLRSVLSLLEQSLLAIKTGLEHREPGDRSYLALLERERADPPGSYRMAGRQRDFAVGWLDRLSRLIEEIEEMPRDRRFSQGAPRPRPMFRVVPTMMTDEDADLPAEPARRRDPVRDAHAAVTPPEEVRD